MTKTTMDVFMDTILATVAVAIGQFVMPADGIATVTFAATYFLLGMMGEKYTEWRNKKDETSD